MSLGKKIRHYREKQNLTLEQLSELSGVDLGTISALEVRNSSRSKYAPELAEALGIPLESLFSEKTVEPKNFDGKVYWPFGDFSQYESLSPAKKDQLAQIVEAFIAGAQENKSGTKKTA